MKKNNSRKKTAFSLIEVIMVLFIASVGIIAALSLAVRSANFQQSKKELGTAMFLANEGIEIMKNIKDTNIILGREYNIWDGSTIPSNGVRFYQVDYANLVAVDVASINDSVLQQDSLSGFFSHDTFLPDSIFSRLITITTSDDSSEVESWVRWKSRGNVFDYKVSTIFYDNAL